ncbi:DedA family protein [Modestobacter italicus]|uniref:DedA family protein n=1 Tax=Modestobacter italicus (strain DSM 44449 / CECT 9708 / BC 501) TaxID=2732864 RepID=UPI001C986061|nr:hypothetical protein [Modestobacter italicus]
MTTWAADVPAVLAALLVAVVLIAEAGLLIGLALPSTSLVLGLGVLAGAGTLPPPVAALSAAAATVLGAALGHRTGGGPGTIGARLPARLAAVGDRLLTPWVEAVGRRPVRAAATAQFVGGARTLAPRAAAQAGVPLATMLRGTVPAALVWSTSLVLAGSLATSVVPLLQDATALLGVPVVVIATCVLLRRRATTRNQVTGHGTLSPA